MLVMKLLPIRLFPRWKRLLVIVIGSRFIQRLIPVRLTYLPMKFQTRILSSASRRRIFMIRLRRLLFQLTEGGILLSVRRSPVVTTRVTLLVPRIFAGRIIPLENGSPGRVPWLRVVHLVVPRWRRLIRSVPWRLFSFLIVMVIVRGGLKLLKFQFKSTAPIRPTHFQADVAP